VDRERFEQELVLLLQRLDVAEELDRLTGHIERRGASSAHRAGRPPPRLPDAGAQPRGQHAVSKSQELDTTRSRWT
jgi:hypothetical protein